MLSSQTYRREGAISGASGRLGSMQISLEGNDTLLVAHDASLFHSDWSGKIEFRFRTSQARAFLDKLRESGLGEA